MGYRWGNEDVFLVCLGGRVYICLQCGEGRERGGERLNGENGSERRRDELSGVCYTFVGSVRAIKHVNRSRMNSLCSLGKLARDDI